MDPMFLSIGKFSLRWYGVMAAAGFLAALIIMQLNRRYAKLSADQTANIVIAAMLSGVIGSRIFYVIQNWNYYRNHIGQIIRIDQGGLVFYGGFILAALVLIFYVKKICRADAVRVLDITAPALAAAHALGRVGCFFNGCCYGKPAELFWAVTYPVNTPPYQHYAGAALHPVQLYEAALNLLLAPLFFLLVRKAKRGVAMSCYILSYGVLRFIDEFFRGDHTDFVRGFTPAQVIGFALIPLGVFLLVKFLRAPQQEQSGSNINQAAETVEK